jgi:hypothetical protein
MLSIRTIPVEVLRDVHHLSPHHIKLLYGREVVKTLKEKQGTFLETFRELVIITEALGQRGIRALALKGPVLAYRLYGDVTARYYTDLDILVDENDAGRAIDVLRELGYNNYGSGWPNERRDQQKLIVHDYHVALIHPDKMMPVELHWRLSDNYSSVSQKFDDLFRQNQEKIEIAGYNFFVLSNEMEFLFMVIHGGKHGWRRLKWLLDADEFIRTQPIDRERFKALVSSIQAGRMLALFVEVYLLCFPGNENQVAWLSQITQEKVPAGMIRFAIKSLSDTEDREHNSISGIVRSLSFTLRSFPGFGYKLRVLRNYLFVKEFLGQSRFFSRIPLFYFYSFCRLAVNRIMR